MPYTLSKELLQKLYGSGKSISEVSDTLKISFHKTVYWMDKFGIKRRTRSEAGYIKNNPNGDPFKISDVRNNPELAHLKGLGLGIYWGEGSKRSKNSLRVSNTDSGVIKTFREFLYKICSLEPNKLSYSIVCFNDSDADSVREHWAKTLGILPGKFGKITVIPKQGRGTYKNKSKFGVCTITANNTKLRNWLIKELSEIGYSPG